MEKIRKSSLSKTLQVMCCQLKAQVVAAFACAAISGVMLAVPLASAAEPGNQTAPTEQVISKININQASAEDLMLLKGIGEKKAKAIVEYRKQHGNFTSVEDLTQIKGIGESFIEKNRPYISL